MVEAGEEANRLKLTEVQEGAENRLLGGLTMFIL